MFKMLGQFWTMLTVLFASGEKVSQALGNSAINLATVAEEMSQQYLDETRIERAKQLKLLEAE